jgi:hypothetical protein
MAAELSHPTFVQPSDPGVKLWRYMDFTKFVSLLEQGAFFFSRADLLGDPYEGATTHFNRENAHKVYQFKNLDQVIANISITNEWMRQWTFVSCWHMNEVESAAMWRLYAQTNEAVAVQTTFRKLADALPSKVLMGQVRYINYEKDWLPEGNTYYAYTHKRHSFEHEREVRAIFSEWPTRPDVKDGHAVIDISANNPEGGRLVHVNLEGVLENVFVAPTAPAWFSSLVGSVMKRYELTTPLNTSSLARRPVF